MKNTGRIPDLLSIVGIVLLIISLIWWQQTFGLNGDFIKCLAVSDGVCRIGGLSGLFGSSPYNPIIFWAAVICLAGGFVLKKLGR